MKELGIGWIERALCLALCAGCGSSPDADAAGVPELSVASDENEDPLITEISLEAREATKTYANGRTTPVWTYNGSVPGPLIEAAVKERTWCSPSTVPLFRMYRSLLSGPEASEYLTSRTAAKWTTPFTSKAPSFRY